MTSLCYPIVHIVVSNKMPVTQNIKPLLLHVNKMNYFASGHNSISHDIKYKNLVVLVFASMLQIVDEYAAWKLVNTNSEETGSLGNKMDLLFVFLEDLHLSNYYFKVSWIQNSKCLVSGSKLRTQHLLSIHNGPFIQRMSSWSLLLVVFFLNFKTIASKYYQTLCILLP